MLPVQPVREYSFVGVEVIQDDIGIGRTAGREDDDFGDAGQFTEEVVAMRPHSDACLYFGISTEMVEAP